MSPTTMFSTLPQHDSIRLLQLQLNSEDQPLVCSLTVIDSYTTAPEYNAVSYCWGDRSDTVNILCNGTPFPVTRSINNALLRLRQKAVSHSLWVDAICINQKDIEERGQQVSIMKQIYLQASRIFIWTGPGDEHSASAIRAIRSIGHECCMVLYGPDPSPASWLEKLHKEEDRLRTVQKTDLVELTSITRTEFIPVYHFFQRKWFSRVWVIQEVQGSSRIHLLCGADEIEWDFVAMAANWLNHVYDRDHDVLWAREYFPFFSGFQNAFLMWSKVFCTRREAPFPALLNSVARFNSTDRRDKIFALLQYPIQQYPRISGEKTEILYFPKDQSESETATHLEIQANYNLPTYEVYRDVTLKSIQSYRNLEVLCYAWQRNETDEPFPSWVPLWNTGLDSNTYVAMPPFLYNAAGETPPRSQLAADGKGLIVQGLNLGTIVEIDSILTFEPSHAANFDSGETIKQSLMEMSQIMVADRWQKDAILEAEAERASGESGTHFADFAAYLLPLLESHRKDCYVSLVSVWCVVCKTQTHTGRQPSLEPTRAAYGCQICDHGTFALCDSCHDSGIRCKGGNEHPLTRLAIPQFYVPYTDGIIEQLKLHTDHTSGDRFFEMSRATGRQRMFIRTSKGWRGMGSRKIRPGDVLVALFGSRVPFILRPCGAEYRLVSDCYVHGVMDGEAVRMWEKGEVDVQDFVIC